MHHAIKSATVWVCLKGGYLYNESSKSTGSSFFRPMKWPELVDTPSFRQTYAVMGIKPSYYQETSYWRHGPSKSIPCFRLPGWICIYEGPLHCPPRHHQHQHHHHHHHHHELFLIAEHIRTINANTGLITPPRKVGRYLLASFLDDPLIISNSEP